MRYDIILQKGFIPRVKIQCCDVADLPADPIAFWELALKFSDALQKKIVADINAPERYPR